MSLNSAKIELNDAMITDVAGIEQCQLNESGQLELYDGAYWQLFEKSRVGDVGKYTVYINSDDSGLMPHFHIIDSASYNNKKDDPWEFHTCLEILRTKYFRHKSKQKDDIINTAMAAELIAFLSAPKTNSRDTNWQYLINLWNDNNTNVGVSPDMPIPDYTRVNEVEDNYIKPNNETTGLIMSCE